MKFIAIVAGIVLVLMVAAQLVPKRDPGRQPAPSPATTAPPAATSGRVTVDEVIAAAVSVGVAERCGAPAGGVVAAKAALVVLLRRADPGADDAAQTRVLARAIVAGKERPTTASECAAMRRQLAELVRAWTAR